MVALYADDAIISLITRCFMSDLFFFFFFSFFNFLPSMLPVWLAEILKFVLIISPPQQNPSIEKSPIRIPQELQLWRPFHTAQ